MSICVVLLFFKRECQIQLFLILLLLDQHKALNVPFKYFTFNALEANFSNSEF